MLNLVMSVVLLFYRITRDINPGLANFRNLEEQQFLLGAIGGLSGKKIPDTLTFTRSHDGMHFNLSYSFFAAQKAPECPVITTLFYSSFISKRNFTIGVLNLQSDFPWNVPRMLQ